VALPLLMPVGDKGWNCGLDGASLISSRASQCLLHNIMTVRQPGSDAERRPPRIVPGVREGREKPLTEPPPVFRREYDEKAHASEAKNT